MLDIITGIHGLANKPNKKTLEDWWKKSILEGLKKNCGIDNPVFDFEMSIGPIFSTRIPSTKIRRSTSRSSTTTSPIKKQRTAR